MFRLIKREYIYLALAIVLVVVLFFKFIEIERLNNQSLLLKDTIRNYQIELGGLQKQVWEQSAKIKTQQQAIRDGDVTKEELIKTETRLLSTVIKLEAEVRSLKDSLRLQPETQIVYIKDSVESYKAIRLPFENRYKDEYIDIKTGVKEDATWYYDIKAPLSAKVLIDVNSRNPKAVVITESPYIPIKEVSTIVIPKKKPFYEKWYFAGGVGLILGLLVK